MEGGKGKSLEELYKRAVFYNKEYDLDTTLKICAFLRWKEPGKDSFYLSPLLYKPAKIKWHRKVESSYEIEADDEVDWMINPIVLKSLNRFFDLELTLSTSHVIDTVDSLISQLSVKGNTIGKSNGIEHEDTWAVCLCDAVGNYNYKKSLLGADYDHILSNPSKQIEKLFTPIHNSNDDNRLIYQITDLDESQLNAIKKARTNDLVIQGPPGTGKSQTIVALIGQFLADGKKVLFVSQKRSALDVVKERLSVVGLGSSYAYFNTEKDEKKSFYTQLKRSWDKLHIKTKDVEPPQKRSSAISDFYLGHYVDHDTILDDSIVNVVAHLADKDRDIYTNPLKGRVPSLKEWKDNFDHLLRIESKIQQHTTSSTIHKSFVSVINKAIFTETEPLLKLETRLEQLLNTVNEIEVLGCRYALEGNIVRFTQIAIAASILNMVNRSQLNMLNTDSSAYKSFGNLANKYQQVKLKVDRISAANSKWKNKPTKLEITELIDLIKHQHAPKGILGILRRKNERLEAAFKDFDRHLSDVAKLQLLEELRNELNLKTELDEIVLKLKHKYNIADPENEVDQILKLRNKLNEISKNSYLEILEHEKSIELIQDLSDIHPKIQNFNHLSRFIFENNQDVDLSVLKENITRLLSDLEGMKMILPELQLYFKLPPLIREFLSQNQGLVRDLNLQVTYQNLIEVTRHKPIFDELTGHTLQNELIQLEKEANGNQKFNATNLLNQLNKGLNEIENLLNTPASKLKEEDKERKKALKNEFRILIHEIAKQKQHLSIKQFMDSCWQLLSTVNPVWIMNPLSVSERLKCQEGLFDVVIFDESSQIPLEDAIPSIYRAKQIIVVGDSKQMPPATFFRSNSESPTLLDQSEKVLSNVMLKWHYRSEHPALINFSNGYFYENELMVLPPVNVEMPLQYRNVKGVFEDRINIEEAKEVAKFLKNVPETDLDKYAVIAFSKDQEDEIVKQLKKNAVPLDALLVRNLENVQGIERDEVIISVGYGKNKEGVFRLNFGPVNQQFGANRLNVLFTRAKKKIILITSVDKTDFGLTDNFGVNCLSDYISYVQDSENNSHVQKGGSFGFSNVKEYDGSTGSSVECYVQHETGKVLLVDPCVNSNTSDLLTLNTILRSRYKAVKILLSKDKFNNPDSFQLEIEDFFK